MSVETQITNQEVYGVILQLELDGNTVKLINMLSLKKFIGSFPQNVIACFKKLYFSQFLIIKSTIHQMVLDSKCAIFSSVTLSMWQKYYNIEETGVKSN